MGDLLKLVPVAMAVFGACALAGCQERLTLEEAQARCKQQGGYLVVIYTQPISTSGVGPEEASPGDCVSASKFDVAKPAPGTAPAPAPAN